MNIARIGMAEASMAGEPSPVRISPAAARLAGLAICLLAIAPFYLAAARYNRNRGFLARAVPTQATIIDYAVKGAGEDARYTAVFVFADSQGRTHTSSATFSTATPVTPVGEKIRVLYDSANPAFVRIPSFTTLWTYIVVAGGFGLALLVFGLIVCARGHRFILRLEPRQ